ncbi:hypothetical protein GQX73_g5126 [Xylaria multiplex]|uniref:Uncharacterized protein n=1 Tax=Xylaria multiplex TaxID=323545 RepID=A0A7C8INS9_9PEZI|nr:hypothetical protein GQX73_g5126 [Xylaria multiplex]
MNMRIISRRLLFVACLVITAKADGWDDFSNNLSTDLAPLLALFGEQVTKQFLSESTTLLDNFIFAVAPLGIITAIVSAIRVCGGPSLRAFIGRAQEGGGIAEAELCSSTSRDVCELYHNGAIVRVFGRPKILEIVHDRDAALLDDNSEARPDCGIYSFQEYIKKGFAKKAGWKEQNRRDGGIEDQQKPLEGDRDKFAPNPNLSFNIGIREQPGYVLVLAAVAGFLIQAAVLVFGFLATYTWRWPKDDALPPDWAFPIMSLGTLLLSGGMFFCAFLIEDSTKERVFRRDSTEDRNSPTIYVVQPGNQIVGDQTFDAFSFTDASRRLRKYTTSWKMQKTAEVKVCFATGITLAGFVFQFVGLRAMHSSVSVFQLGTIALMSVVRAGLRTQRLAKEQNLLRDRPDEVQGHELDWLALQMAKNSPEEPETGRKLWSVIGGPVKLPSPSNRHKQQLARRVFLYRSRLAELTSQPMQIKSKSSARAIESTSSILFSYGTVNSSWKNINSIPWAIQVVEYERIKVKDSGLDQIKLGDASDIHLHLRKGTGSKKYTAWEVSQYDLEAVIGLWTWSIISDPLVEEVDEFNMKVSEALEVPASRIMAIGATEEEIDRARRELELWIEDFPSSALSKRWTPDPESTHSGIIQSVAQMGVSTPACHLVIGGPPQRRSRIYGWQIAHDSSLPEMVALTTPIANSIYATCAHDIYQSFLCAVMEVLKSLGGETKFVTGGRGYLLTNEVITRIAECFKESGLGSTQDAYSVIIPALRYRPGLPSPKDTILSVHIGAENRRREGRFEEAEAILRQAWEVVLDISDEELSAATMLELGELYRYAVFQNKEALKDFGHEGISWMKNVTGGRPPSDQVAVIANRYADLERMSKDDPEPETSAKRVMDAISKDDRTKALWLMSHVREVLGTDVNDRTILSWAAQRGWPEIVKAAIETGLVVDDRDRSKRTPLSYAAEQGHARVVEILLRRGALPFTQDESRRTPLSYASGRGHHCAMKVLLDDRRVSVSTLDNNEQSPLHWAASNGHDGAIELLLQHGANETLNKYNRQGFPPLVAALLNGHMATAEILVKNGAEFDVSIGGVEGWEWALQKWGFTCAAFFLGHLNQKRKQKKIIVVTVGSGREFSPVRPFGGNGDTWPFEGEGSLGSRDFPLPITVYVLARDGKETESTIEAILSLKEFGLVVKMEMCELRESSLEYDPLQIDLSAKVYYDPFQRSPKYRLIDYLLVQKEEARITEGLLQAAIRDSDGYRIMQLFLDRRGEEVKVTEGILLAIAEDSNGYRKMNLLLDRRRKEVKITESIVKAAAGNKWSGKAIIQELLNRRGKEVKITESILLAAAGNSQAGYSMIELLLDIKGEEVKITESVLKAAAENEKNSKEIMELLLDRRGEEFKITESILQKAAGNGWDGKATIKLLLDRRGKEVKVTESILQAAAGNNQAGYSIIELLLNKRGEEVKLTEGILQAAAGNIQTGYSTIKLLLGQGGEVKITESVRQAAAGNDRDGKAIIKMLQAHKEKE